MLYCCQAKRFRCRLRGGIRGNMKYMTFNSSCSYAGLANMLEYHGVDTEDRQIALDMGLPFLFSKEGDVYGAGPMLQTAEWFHLYLKPRGFRMTETSLSREAAGEFLRSIPCGMLGLTVDGGGRHAVVYRGMAGGRYEFLNNKRQHSPEPDSLLLTEEELLSRLSDTAVVAVIERAEPVPVPLEEYFQSSIEVLAGLKNELFAFCAKVRSMKELTEARNRLFRAILLDAVTMLELLGEKRLRETLLQLQRRLVNILKEGKPQILQDRMSMEALGEAIDGYMELIREQIQAGRA